MYASFKRVIMICTLVLLFLCAPFWGDRQEVYAANGTPDYVVVLDAGHDSSHSGAHQNGYGEEHLVLKIAQYCKMELERTPGVKVYMVRDSEECPYGGSSIGNNTVCNAKRVAFSKSVKADLYISFHLDSSGSSARGASVYYPNDSWRPEIGAKGKAVATNILAQLKAMGISQRGSGIMIRNSENGTTYPDGSIADYLAVIKGNKQNNIPAALIEHCYISNKADCNNFLSSDGKLHLLGRADSIGILNYLGINNTALKMAADGTWYFYRDGNIDYGYTGLAANNSGWWYVRNGKVDFSSTTIVAYKGSYWYVNKGKYDATYTGVARNQNGDWYVRNGEVDFGFNGLANINATVSYNNNSQKLDGWYNFRNGQIIYKDDVVKYNNIWWYVQRGKVNFEANTIAPNSQGWWYIKNGQVDFSFNGIASNSNGEWYIKGGKVMFDTTALVTIDNTKYYICNGKVTHNATTLAYDGKIWWYIKNGIVQENANTIMNNDQGWWYIKNGQVDFSFNGIARNDYGDWYIKGGKVQFGATGLVNTPKVTQTYPDTNSEPISFEGWYAVKNGKLYYQEDVVQNSQGWWYVGADGKVDFKFTGIASNAYGTWYLENGKVDFTYNNQEFVYRDKCYSITNGKAIEISAIKAEPVVDDDNTEENESDDMLPVDGVEEGIMPENDITETDVLENETQDNNMPEHNMSDNGGTDLM